MRKTVTFVLFVLMSTAASASHIVGGEIELLHLKDFRYRINLIYYFDVVHNPGRRPEVEEDSIQLFIFRKIDNKQIAIVNLPWLSKKRVSYTQPSCSQGEIVTDKLIYSTEVTLSPEIYNSPQGYYITWARCCRNYTILNIYSQNPNVGLGAGQTFYHEFPPVMLNGAPFVNSSPRNFPALNDYACPTRPYYVDFAGVDDDGDSLVYSLTTPLSTVTVTPAPPPSPAPYPEIKWIPGFGLDRVINGSPKLTAYPDLAISKAGFLRVTPRSLGLYVFAVKVEEFRDKIKIGETRRDFQMLVTDCKLAVAPQISGKPISGGPLKRGNLSVNYSNNVSDDNRCIVVSVSDADALRAADNFQEVITLKIVALNFKGTNLSSMLPEKSTGIIKNNGTVEFNICFPSCPLITGGAYQIGVIALDDACALPLSDTLKVEVQVEPPDNKPAQFSPPDHVVASLNEGDSHVWPFEATDADGDELRYFALAQGFSISGSGMKTTIKTNVAGSGLLQGELEWKAFCDIYDFTKRTDFTLQLLVDDLDACDLNDPDTLTYQLKVILPGNNLPIIDTDLTPDPAEVVVDGITRRVFESLRFNVTGHDLVDNDLVGLKMVGDGFNPIDYGMVFQKASAKGMVQSAFRWDLVCSKIDLAKRDTFNIAFVAIDSINKCRHAFTDSLVVKVKVLKPLNNPPQLIITSLTDGVAFSNNTVSVKPNTELVLDVSVRDIDEAPKDFLGLSLIKVSGTSTDNKGDPPDNYEFVNATGTSVLSSPFRWTPLCNLFPGIREGKYFFDFRYNDDRCVTAYTDTLRVTINVKDNATGELLADPANVFTPNDDGFNDYYSMERIDAEGNRFNLLPPDDCTGAFQFVRIYNRWGETVFSSTQRDFRWLGLKEPAGVYFYLIKYSNREFKGTVSLRN